MNRNKTKNFSLVEVAANQLIELVLEHGLKPGDKLPNEYELARQLGVGRSTLREAIKRLVARNVLETHQGAGTFVSKKNGVPEDPLGLTFIAAEGNIKLALELSDMRILIEPYVAALAAQNATDKQIETMREICLEIKKAMEAGEDYVEHDTKLHCYIGQCCGNTVLQNLVMIIGDAARISVGVTKDKYRDVAFTEHWAIVRAIERRDVDGARYAMLSHLNTARDDLAQRLIENCE